MKKKKLLHLWC